MCSLRPADPRKARSHTTRPSAQEPKRAARVGPLDNSPSNKSLQLTNSLGDLTHGPFSKDIETMDDLFVHQLQDIYYTEKRIVGALPEMIEKAIRS
jgi:hypothetical protein